jgi:hypothetical protein
MRLEGHVARMTVKKNAYSVLVQKPEVKSPPGRSKRRWELNIKIYLGGVGCMSWIHLAQDGDISEFLLTR